MLHFTLDEGVMPSPKLSSKSSLTQQNVLEAVLNDMEYLSLTKGKDGCTEPTYYKQTGNLTHPKVEWRQYETLNLLLQDNFRGKFCCIILYTQLAFLGIGFSPSQL